MSMSYDCREAEDDFGQDSATTKRLPWLPAPDGPGSWWTFKTDESVAECVRVEELPGGLGLIARRHKSIWGWKLSEFSGPWQRAIVPERPQ